MNKPGEEVLLSRVTDRSATADDWGALEKLACSDPDVWRRLALTLRNECLLAAAVQESATAAARVDLPASGFRRTGIVFTWPRAVAASLVVAALLVWTLDVGGLRSGGPAVPDPHGPPLTSEARAPSYLESYLRQGQAEGIVLEELPPLVLEHRPIGDGGGVEVYFVRRVLERRVVEEAFQVGVDEDGQPLAAPVAVHDLAPSASL